MEPGARILILEGPLSRGLAALLATEGLEISQAESLKQVIARIGEATRLIVLDTLAPGVSQEVWERLLEAYEGRVLLISPSMGKLQGEVVTAPFELQDLVRRVRKLLAGQPGMVVRVGELVIDLAARRVTVGGKRIHLARLEFEVLAHLARNAGRTVSYEELLEEVWGYLPAQRDWKVVTNCVGRLLRKLGEDPNRPAYLINLRGVGYRLRSQEQWEKMIRSTAEDR